MPKVVYTSAKGLVQEAGSGFDVSTTGVTGAGGFFAGFIPNSAPESLTATIPLSVTKHMSFIALNNVSRTLAAGTVTGQLKKILAHIDTAGADTVLTAGTTAVTITFTNLGDYAELIWTGASWRVLALYNVAAGTTSTPISA